MLFMMLMLMLDDDDDADDRDENEDDDNYGVYNGILKQNKNFRIHYTHYWLDRVHPLQPFRTSYGWIYPSLEAAIPPIF